MKKLEDAKKFVKEHAASIALCTTGVVALGVSCVLYEKAGAKNCKAFTDGLTKGAANVLTWAVKNVPDANLDKLWDSELAEACKKMGISVTQF